MQSILGGFMKDNVILAASRLGPADEFEEAYPGIHEDPDEELEQLLGALSKGAKIGLSKLAQAMVDPRLDAEAAAREASRIQQQLVAMINKFVAGL
jgi:hypothetical protein